MRVRADKLDTLIDLIGELVIAGSGAQMVAHTAKDDATLEAMLRVMALMQDTRDAALGLRMVPVGETFGRFQRVVRDVSKQLGKEIELVVTGGDTEMDKSMVDAIADPLMHLVRNSMDHGLEPPEEREAAGKPRSGTLRLNAFHEAGAIVIEVRDDGRGLARERILAKAIERELIGADQLLSDAEVWQLIFQPGFSTAEAVTDLSGRDPDPAKLTYELSLPPGRESAPEPTRPETRETDGPSVPFTLPTESKAVVPLASSNPHTCDDPLISLSAVSPTISSPAAVSVAIQPSDVAARQRVTALMLTMDDVR